MQVISTEVRSHIGTLWLDRPEKLNAMGTDFWTDLPAAVKSLDSDPAVRVILVRARGRHFSVGLDLTQALLPTGGHGGAGSQSTRATHLYHKVKELQDAISSLDYCKKPTIAAIHGYCIGGGVDLISACNIRLASRDAIFSVREAKIAIVADIGSLQRLPQILPKGILYELAMSARDFTSEEALRWGLLNEVCEDQDKLEERSVQVAESIANNSPVAVEGTKAILDGIYNRHLREDLDRVALWNAAFLASNDLKEAMSAFSEKREASFRGD